MWHSVYALHTRAQTELDEVAVLIDTLAGVLGNRERALSTALNTLLASPSFASWRQGATLVVMPRHAMSFIKGPMTRGEIRRAVGEGR